MYIKTNDQCYQHNCIELLDTRTVMGNMNQFTVLIASALFVLVAQAQDHQHKDHHVEGHRHAHPKYEFKYGVKDTHTHDIKEQEEKRDGHKVEGHYKLHEADGTIRTVHYNADKHTGFHAHVQRSGHATHPIHHEKKIEVHHKKEEEAAPKHKFTASSYSNSHLH